MGHWPYCQDFAGSWETKEDNAFLCSGLWNLIALSHVVIAVPSRLRLVITAPNKLERGKGVQRDPIWATGAWGRLTSRIQREHWWKQQHSRAPEHRPTTGNIRGKWSLWCTYSNQSNNKPNPVKLLTSLYQRPTLTTGSRRGTPTPRQTLFQSLHPAST